MRSRTNWFLRLMCAVALVGCGDDGGGMADSGMADSSMTDSAMTDAMADASPDGMTDSAAPDSGPDGGAGSRFVLRIENVSGGGPIPGPVSPGVALAVAEMAPLFSAGEVDRGEGLAAIAEDGNPATLGAALSDAVVFNTPMGAADPGPAFPMDAYEVEVVAEPGDALHFATMFVQSNDVILAPDGAGIALFEADGTPMAERDVTAEVQLWDVGSEANEAPGAGPNQAPRQSAADVGAAEGTVRMFTGTTHALPSPDALVTVDVSEAGGTYSVTLTNAAPITGTLLSPISPTFWASHASTASLFTAGDAASAALEELAEDGSPAALVAALTGAAGFGDVGAVGSAPVMGGESLSFDVTPTMATPMLSFATMVVQTNDGFLALPSSGIRLLDGAGAARPAADVQAELRRRLAVWNAGTEIDQIPGAGPDQAPRQAAPNTGASDPDATVRRYSGSTNALAVLDGFVEVSIVNGASDGDFDVTVSTVGVAEGFPILTPVAWATHTAATALFTEGMAASGGLEALAEDGDPSVLSAALGADADVGTTGVMATPVGAAGPGPALPGGSYTFTVTPDVMARFFSFATMLVPSNDLFLAFAPEGIALLDDTGAARSDEDIATDISALLAAWDAGTEQNQSGAAGSDQAPRQAGPNTGEAEGNGLVRAVPDIVWSYPDVANIVRVTIRPAD